MSAVFRLALLLVAVSLVALLGGCGGGIDPSSSASTSGHKFVVVAAENSWGSIATQLAGEKASVQSVIVDPHVDPHGYEPTAQDARAIASAGLAIVNGVGYDKWMSQSLAASPAHGRLVLDVGHLLGLEEGENPHQWYSPGSVVKVIDAIVADYKRLDPVDSAYFDHRKQVFMTRDLARYDQLRREIRSRYAGVPVGYSESIFRPLGEDLGLKLLTPSVFANAVSEGGEITVQDKQAVDRQAEAHQIAVWVYNSQNLTPDVKRVTAIVRARRIPIASVTETLSPASSDFQQWQVAQLEDLIAALHRATGK